MFLDRYSVTKSDPTLRPHGLQHIRLLWPSLCPRVCSNSRPLSWWCYLTISSSAAFFSFCLQSFPASGSFQWVSSSHQVAKVLELQHQSFYEYSGSISFRFDWFDLPTVQRTLQSLPQQRNLKASVLRCSAFFMVQLSHDYWKNHSFDCMDLWQQRDVSAF